MMWRLLEAEWLKWRRSRMWIVLMTLPVLSVLIGSANYALNLGILRKEWYSLWSQVSLFYGEFFLPVLIAIACSHLCRLEHANRNWRNLLTAPIALSRIYLSKWAVLAWHMLLVQSVFFLLYLCAGKLLSLSTPLPKEILGWMTRGWIASITIGAIHLWLSMRIRSFAVPVGISLCGVLIGLGMVVNDWGLYFPYSLLTIGMGVLSQEGLTTAELLGFLTSNLLYTILFSTLALRRLKHPEGLV